MGRHRCGGMMLAAWAFGLGMLVVPAIIMIEGEDSAIRHSLRTVSGYLHSTSPPPSPPPPDFEEWRPMNPFAQQLGQLTPNVADERKAGMWSSFNNSEFEQGPLDRVGMEPLSNVSENDWATFNRVNQAVRDNQARMQLKNMMQMAMDPIAELVSFGLAPMRPALQGLVDPFSRVGQDTDDDLFGDGEELIFSGPGLAVSPGRQSIRAGPNGLTLLTR